MENFPPVEYLSSFESASPERAKRLSRVHLMRSQPPKTIPLCESQLCLIKYLITGVIALGPVLGGKDLGHTSSARHIFSVSSTQILSWSGTTGWTQHYCRVLFSPQIFTSPEWHSSCDLFPDWGPWRSACASKRVQQGPAFFPSSLVILGPSVLTVPRTNHCMHSLVGCQDPVSYKDDWKSS